VQVGYGAKRNSCHGGICRRAEIGPASTFADRDFRNHLPLVDGIGLHARGPIARPAAPARPGGWRVDDAVEGRVVAPGLLHREGAGGGRRLSARARKGVGAALLHGQRARDRVRGGGGERICPALLRGHGAGVGNDARACEGVHARFLDGQRARCGRIAHEARGSKGVRACLLRGHRAGVRDSAACGQGVQPRLLRSHGAGVRDGAGAGEGVAAAFLHGQRARDTATAAASG